ncbi:unnamed protein product [Penicillium bialowiezense]
MTDATETTRLHISPLTPDILPSVLPASIRNLATDVSFHELATFPENSYGYVTLPKMEAEKIKKKLNGAMLKGKKFKVEAARPSKRHLELEDPVLETNSSKKKSKKSKTQEPEDGVIEGFELPEGRKVKRGWTESSDAKQERRKSEKKDKKEKKDKDAKLQPKSKYTDKSECLFRATLPPNRAADAAADDKKNKKKKSKDNVVHEFTKLTTQPSFLRTTQETVPPTATFEEGKGWVDADGNLKEAANEKIKKHNKYAGAKEKYKATKSADKKKRSRKEKTPEESSESEDYTSSSGSSAEESSDSESEEEQVEEPSAPTDSDEEEVKPQATKEEPAESSDASDSESESEAEPEPEAKAEPTKSDSEEATPEAPEVENVPAKEVHPLEALFKRAAPTASEDQPKAEPEAGFSFFGNDIESEDEQPEPQPPFTPFTKNDLQNRGQRSAAPTPDTAAANRHTTWNEAEESDEASIDSPVKARTSDDNDETEFAKWFWENRGDNNRAWKKRRRDAAKEQRQRDNRKKGIKGRS